MPACAKCKRDLPLSAFSKPHTDKKGRTYKRSYCKECSRRCCSDYAKANRAKRNLRLRGWRKRNPTLVHGLDKRKRLKKKYGLTPELYAGLKESCQGRCSLCSQPTKALELDHDHKTKRLRGFVCRKCNLLLGLIEDRNLPLDQIAAYLGESCHADVILEVLAERGKNE